MVRVHRRVVPALLRHDGGNHVVKDGDGFLCAATGERGIERRAEEKDGRFHAFRDAVVLHADADVLRRDARRKGEGAPGDGCIAIGGVHKRPVLVVTRGAAAPGGVVHGDGVARGGRKDDEQVAVFTQRAGLFTGGERSLRKADGDGGGVIVRDLEGRGGRPINAVAGAGLDVERHGFGAFAERIVNRRHREIHAGLRVGNHHGARERLVIDAVRRRAGHGVVHREVSRGAGAGEVERARGRAGF